jgi:putative flippase GtrA
MEKTEKKDIFDRIMGWGFLKTFEPFYKKNKEILLYLFFGVMTTVVSFITAGIAKVLLEKLGASENAVINISTVFSWICSVTFAYITNRIWVFESTARGASAIVKEGASFYGGRLFTMFVEMLIMNFGVKLIGANYWVTKVIANVIIIILNYIISKLFVFKKQK